MHSYFTFSFATRKYFWQIIWLLLLLTVQACRTETASPVPAPQISPANPAQPSPSPHSIPPSSTPPPSPAPTQMPDPVCVQPGGIVPSLAPGEFNTYGDQITSLLNAGAAPEDLRRALEDAGIASQPVALLPGDLNGDGKTDLALSIYDPESTSFPPASAILVYLCDQNIFRQVHREDRPQGSHLWYFMDMNADGGSELVVSWAQCGVHTCFEEVQILMWDRIALSNRLEGSTAELAFPLIEVVDGDRDGYHDLEISASGPGSAGAGPPRNSLNRWTYQPASRSWQFAGQTLLPSSYRIHVLNDADAAARAGSFQQALEAYQRVILDDTLQDWVDPARERVDLQAYARFRMVVLLQRMDQRQAAEQAYQELVEATPENSPQAAYVELARLFLQAAHSGDLEAGCAAVEAYANAHTAQVLLPLNSFGYAVPGVTAADLCP